MDVVQRLIKVTPWPIATYEVGNIDKTGFLASQAGDSLAATSLISTNSYTSILGIMLQNNIFNVKKQGTDETDEETTLRGTAESLQALADQSLFSISSAQLMIANDTTSAPVTASMQALRIGKPVLIYAGAAMNALLVLLLLFQAARTRLWDGLPRFNFSDVKSLVVGTSHGGSRIAEIVRDGHWRSGSVWSGEADDRVAGNIPVNLVRETGSLALIVALTE